MAPSALTVLFAVCAAWDVPHALAQSLRGDQNVTRLSKTIAGTEPASCSAADESKMSTLGGGNADGTFPKYLAECGKKNYNIFSGFNSARFLSCVEGNTGISSTCAECFSLSAGYGADHCKWACFWGSWCGSNCLDCVASANKATAECAGVPVPQAAPCR
mmetsp:Transcript_24114/g.55935  ORF Transcript_24114/g.55935 Transcript_24114/m.55935 type:complete len:160 (-) Transcript_24114:303-782(-)